MRRGCGYFSAAAIDNNDHYDSEALSEGETGI